MQKIEKIIAQAMEFIHDYCFAIRDGSFEYFHESIVTQERIVFFRNHASVAFDKEIIIIIAKVLYKEGFAGFSPAVQHNPFVDLTEFFGLRRSLYNHGKYNRGYTYKGFD